MSINFSNKRPIVFVANSSWYLMHYRNGLIKECSKRNKVITISPIDQSTEYLSSISLHLSWRMQRKKDQDIFELFFSTLRMFFLLKAIKPKLVHSHTLKANLVVSICCCLLGIPCILSFSGLGKLSHGKRSYVLFFILKFIYFAGNINRIGVLSFKANLKRTKFIFQNPKDKRIFEEINKPLRNQISLIYGSGVPDKFIRLEEKIKNNNQNNKISNIEGCIYCGRLLKSKGIEIFIKLAELNPSRKYLVFGGIDLSASDSLTEDEIKKYSHIKNLYFKGFNKNPLVKFFKKPYILIVPSVYGEGMPRAIAEALLLEIPVISSNEALSEIFTNRMVKIAKKREPNAYLNCIESIEKELRSNSNNDRKKNGKKFVLNNLTESKVIDKTLNLYKKIEKYDQEIYLNRHYYTKSKFWLSN